MTYYDNRNGSTKVKNDQVNYLLQEGFWQAKKFQITTLELTINNDRVMCQMSMKLPPMFDQNSPCTF